jgi:carbon-monoxide dehydrogenase medium subunit
MWQTYIQPRSIDEVVRLLAQYGIDARVIAGGTDLLFDLERRLRTPKVLIDISRVPGLDYVREDGDHIRIGANVTHSQVLASKLLRERAYPLVLACAEIGLPQVRNRATVVGNIVTASPANDAIAALWAMGAELVLQSPRGARVVTFKDFFKGARQIALEPDEMVVEVACSKMTWKDRANFARLGWSHNAEKALPNVGIVLEFEDDEISNAWITLGAVAPTVVNAIDAEQSLVGQWLNDAVVDEAAELAMNAVEWGGERAERVRGLVARALRQIRDGAVELPYSDLVWDDAGGFITPYDSVTATHRAGAEDVIEMTLNGEKRVVAGAGAKTLLQMLRDDLHLLDVTKCMDGSCGACMVLLDGIAVMGCLIPAPRAHQARVDVAGVLSDGNT